MTPPAETDTPFVMPGIGGVSRDLIKSILKELILEEPMLFEGLIKESVRELEINIQGLIATTSEIRKEVYETRSVIGIETPLEDDEDMIQKLREKSEIRIDRDDVEITGTTKIEIRAKYVYKLLKDAQKGPTGEQYLDSSEIRAYLASEKIPEKYRIVSNPRKTRSTVYNTIQKVAELYKGEVRKGQKEHGKKSIMLIMNKK